ncbi:ArnT family glycosyltransferase [Acidobacteriota bacterium]
MSKIIRLMILIIICLAFLLALTNLYLYFGVFDGDPLIHVAYAEQASQGNWFRFNPTEISSGVTSYLWMFTGALGWKFGGVKGCLFIYDVLIFLSWIGCAFMLYKLIVSWGGKPLFGILAGALFLSFPGIGATSLTGMENMTYSFLFFLFLYAYHRVSSAGSASGPLLSGAVLGLLAGLQILIRPEGYVVALIYAGYELWRILSCGSKEERKIIFRRLFWTASTALVIVAPVWILHYSITGHLFPESGTARLMSARRASTAYHLFGPFWLYARTIFRLGIYFPISAVLFYVFYWFLIPKRAGRRESRLMPDYHSLKLSVYSIGAGILLYTLGTGALHVNRYTIWILGLVTALFALSISNLIDSKGKGMTALAMAAVFLAIVIISGEAIFRYRRGDSLKLQGWNKIQSAVNNREIQTDKLMALLSRNGMDIDNLPLGLLIQEVQVRLCYDDRIKIVSRDGRTSDLNYSTTGCPDLGPLVRSNEVQVIMDDINGGTILRCIQDEELLKISQLYWSSEVIENPSWKKISYIDYPELMHWDTKQRQQKPILLKK